MIDDIKAVLHFGIVMAGFVLFASRFKAAHAMTPTVILWPVLVVVVAWLLMKVVLWSVKRDVNDADLVARADAEHEAWMNGDESGLYGQFPAREAGRR